MTPYIDLVLSAEDAHGVMRAGRAGLAIIVGGDRSTPTGKSTLTEYLRRQGFRVYEEWELEEDEGLQAGPKDNNARVLIELNAPLPEVQLEPWFGRS